MPMPISITFNKTNRVGDDVVLDATEVATRFWASDAAKRWVESPTGPLERLALSWVAEGIGGWGDHADWELIFDAIHAMRPWANDDANLTREETTNG